MPFVFVGVRIVAMSCLLFTLIIIFWTWRNLTEFEDNRGWWMISSPPFAFGYYYQFGMGAHWSLLIDAGNLFSFYLWLFALYFAWLGGVLSGEWYPVPGPTQNQHFLWRTDNYYNPRTPLWSFLINMKTDCVLLCGRYIWGSYTNNSCTILFH